MKISTKGRYALRVMVDLAAHYDKDEFIPLKEIAARQEITIKYLEQIIPALNRAGYVKSVRGNSGGYRLACAPERLTVGDILRASEGSLAPVACLDSSPNLCDRVDYCDTLFVWEGLYGVVNTYLNSISLADIVTRKRTNELSQQGVFFI